jgi:protein SFI1
MFRPPRTSSPSKTTASFPSTRDDSRLTIPELAGLSDDEIDFIDAVVARAGPSATTFLAVLKAYNEVLRARGLDAQSEVVYYGKLLKVGTLKGRNWGEKWAAVKAHNGYDTPSTSRRTYADTDDGASDVSGTTEILPPARKAVSTRLVGGFSATANRDDDDAFTLHSYGEGEQTDADQESAPPTPRLPMRRVPSPSNGIRNSLGLDTGSNSSPPLGRGQPTRAGGLQGLRRAPQLWDSISESGFGNDMPSMMSPTPPSYGTATRGLRIPAPRRVLSTSRAANGASLRPKTTPPTGTVAAPTTSHAVVAQARQKRAAVINEDEAWSKIKMARDEEEADRFREEKLVERCWFVWRQGLDWVQVCSLTMYSQSLAIDAE